MLSAKTHNTPNACTPKPRSNNQTSRNWPASKNYEETLKAMQKADHSRNLSSFRLQHFVCSTCQKRVFNANQDACITKFLKEVDSHAKIQPNKSKNSNKPVEPTSHTQKPVYTDDRIFNTAGLNGFQMENITSSTTKVDCELPNGSNDYITNPYKCDQTLNVSAETKVLELMYDEQGQWLLINSDQHPCFMIMAFVDNTSGPVPQRKERCCFSALYLQKKRNLLVS
ncbi:hypothetical protein Tco_0290783 [Tanacetum coccineum]